MSRLLSELTQLSEKQIYEVHDSEATGNLTPKLAISEEFLSEIASIWNKKIKKPKRGFYKSYIEKTITRYAQDRQSWKTKFKLV